ncbi:MAG: imidazoleglycerol-phosphate dehydratase HisB [Clostridia bacterium]|nr:imidazoleglycerol-phosphate dehydratase HisB [Clostridia bacterium]MBR2296392.1 imidazoleglycerol-phosphate dehydratase HisB [Clostridia bacterium]
MRVSEIKRKTGETDICLKINLDGKGESKIDTGCGFLDHMLTLFAKHARYDLEVKCIGDTNVDYHHTSEDVAICLGKAIYDALGEKRGIRRYGDIILPMDEALIMCAIDISGRDYLGYALEIPAYKVGDFDTELCEEFFRALVREAKLTLHLRQITGANSHHIIEGAFKAVARAMSSATSIDERYALEIPSTKGVI